jgi:hypothetical protein
MPWMSSESVTNLQWSGWSIKEIPAPTTVPPRQVFDCELSSGHDSWIIGCKLESGATCDAAPQS